MKGHSLLTAYFLLVVLAVCEVILLVSESQAAGGGVGQSESGTSYKCSNAAIENSRGCCRNCSLLVGLTGVSVKRQDRQNFPIRSIVNIFSGSQRRQEFAYPC